MSAAVKELEVASYKVSSLKVDVSSRESVCALADKAASLGSVINVVNTAGVSPNMAPPERILAVDLYGSAVAFEEFEVQHGGLHVVIEASPAKRMASPDEIAVSASYLLGPDAGFVTGTDLLIDGGVTSAMLAGLLPTP